MKHYLKHWINKRTIRIVYCLLILIIDIVGIGIGYTRDLVFNPLSFVCFLLSGFCMIVALYLLIIKKTYNNDCDSD